MASVPVHLRHVPKGCVFTNRRRHIPKPREQPLPWRPPPALEHIVPGNLVGPAWMLLTRHAPQGLQPCLSRFPLHALKDALWPLDDHLLLLGLDRNLPAVEEGGDALHAVPVQGALHVQADGGCNLRQECLVLAELRGQIGHSEVRRPGEADTVLAGPCLRGFGGDQPDAQAHVGLEGVHQVGGRQIVQHIRLRPPLRGHGRLPGPRTQHLLQQRPAAGALEGDGGHPLLHCPEGREHCPKGVPRVAPAEVVPVGSTPGPHH
mmetsp:Transcript_29854/g.53699  ORF Transcript_29854/g.53699 Transcript_29854/m.53699 type:complete len:262 (-) Transcript_29854:31-816(-)